MIVKQAVDTLRYDLNSGVDMFCTFAFEVCIRKYV